jgi:hypothetical protein
MIKENLFEALQHEEHEEQFLAHALDEDEE